MKSNEILNNFIIMIGTCCTPDCFLIFIAHLIVKYNETDSNLSLSAIKSLYSALRKLAGQESIL